MKTISENSKVLIGISPDVISGAINGPEIDTAGYEEALIIFQAGVTEICRASTNVPVYATAQVVNGAQSSPITGPGIHRSEGDDRK